MVSEYKMSRLVIKVIPEKLVLGYVMTNSSKNNNKKKNDA